MGTYGKYLRKAMDTKQEMKLHKRTKRMFKIQS